MPRFVWWVATLAAAVLGPAAATAQPVDKPLARIAFGSCSDQDKPLPIFDAVADAKPDLLVLLGDTIYADLDKSRKVTTEVIKEKYDTLAKLPGWQKLKATCPVVATWDDHDYGKNDAGAEWPLKAESQKLFLDFFHVPADSPRRAQKGVYSASVSGPPGKRVQVILLDERFHRSPLKRAARPLPGTRVVPYLPNTDAGATFLGDEQWAWLEAQLKQPAELRLIGSGVQVVADEHPFEKFANIPAERDRLYKLIRSTGANGVVVLSGDRHLGELSLDAGEAVGYPLYDLTSSGFNQAAKAWRPPEKNSHRVAGMPYGDNFGVVTIDWQPADPVVGLELRDVAGRTAVRQAFPLSLLRAKADAAPTPPAAKLPDGVLTPAEARAKVGDEVTVQFEVKGGRAVGGGKRVLLNSEADFRSDTNFTVVVNEKAMTGPFDQVTFETFRGKTVRATGKVAKFKDQVEIIVDAAKQLEVVGEK